MSTNLEYRERERQRKRENRRQAAAKLNEKKSDGERDQEIRSHFLLEEQHEFVAAVRKWEMLAATKEKMSGSVKKVNKNMYGISSIECATRKFNFRTFYVVVVQNNGKEMFTHAARAKFCFAN